VYDPTSLNVNSGTFSVLQQRQRRRGDRCWALLAGLGNYTDNVNLILLHSGGSPGHSGLHLGSIPFRPFFVPEPASIGLRNRAGRADVRAAPSPPRRQRRLKHLCGARTRSFGEKARAARSTRRSTQTGPAARGRCHSDARSAAPRGATNS
jgi:hypothetical protein